MTARPESDQGHGGNALALAAKLGIDPDELLDLSNNTNVRAEPLTRELIAPLSYPYKYYPDPENTKLRLALAEYENAAPGGLLAGNGSSELIHLSLAALRPASVLILGPIFSEYVLACRGLGLKHRVHSLSPESGFLMTREDIRAVADSPAEMIILCNPNNPTGRFDPNLGELLSRLENRIVMIDLAYREFLYYSENYQACSHASLSALLPGSSSLISLGSFTKFFACPGLRLGWRRSDPEAAARLARTRIPWSVNSLAEEAGVMFLRNIESYREAIRDLPMTREKFRRMLGKSGLFAEACESELNFVLARPAPPLSSSALYEKLAAKRIIIRNCDNIPGMNPGWVRIQVRGEEDGAKTLEKALAEIRAGLSG